MKTKFNIRSLKNDFTLAALFQLMLVSSYIFLFACNQRKSENETDKLKSIVQELERGVSSGDPKPWEQYMADDGVLVNRDGKKNTKKEIMNELKPTGKGKYLRIDPVELNVYLNGTSALVSFLADEKLTIHNQKVDTQYPSVMYFEKSDDQWKMKFFSYFEKPVDPARIAVTRDYLQKFEGTYAVAPEMKIEVTAGDSNLFYSKTGSDAKATVLYPINRHGSFFRPGTESEFIFTENVSGEKVILQRRNWIDLVWTKN